MTKAILLQTVSSVAPFEAALIPYPTFPLKTEEKQELTEALLRWVGSLMQEQRLRPIVFLQGSALHTVEEVNLLTDHAAEWMPDLGLGVRPGSPPRLLQQSDFDKLRWDEFSRLQHETLFYLMDEDAALTSAFPAYCGSGALLCCLLDVSTEIYLAHQRSIWLPTIQEPAFRAHPFYVPLLGADDVQPTSAFDRSWMKNVRVYLRESPQDGGLFLISSEAGDMDQLRSAIGR